MAGDGCGEAAKPGLDVAERAAVAPVTLGGEVDDPPGPVATGVEHEHAARPQPALGAGAAVGEEGVGVAALELEGEAGGLHDADAVDGIDDGFGRLGEDVAVRETDHGMLPSSRRRASDQAGRSAGDGAARISSSRSHTARGWSTPRFSTGMP